MLLDSPIIPRSLVDEAFDRITDAIVLGEIEPGSRIREASLARQLGTNVWSRGEAPGLRHSEYGAERFASTLVWAYWPSRHNAYRPQAPRDEAGAVAPSAFRTLLTSLLPAAL